MDNRYILSSLTRISDLSSRDFEVRKLQRDHWETGDYVAAEVIGRPNALYRVELASGRTIEVMEGDHVIGAFGKRMATLEAVGDWEEIGDDLQMSALTSAGLFGKATSISPNLPHVMWLVYAGHVTRDGKKLRMRDFVQPVPSKRLSIPVILLFGTSMSAGKTTTGRIIIHELTRMGRKVIGTKLTGAGRFRDVLSFADAGAARVFDFVDAGLPSTVVAEAEYRPALKNLLSLIEGLEADVMVAEAGASPLEPYNGAVAIEELKDNLCCRVLCASDPYAVLGVQTAFGLRPDLVSGPAASTDAAVALVQKLAGVRALNVIDRAVQPELQRLLEQCVPVKAH